jgi:hypothetical protein
MIRCLQSAAIALVALPLSRFETVEKFGKDRLHIGVDINAIYEVV